MCISVKTLRVSAIYHVICAAVAAGLGIIKEAATLQAAALTKGRVCRRPPTP